MDSGRAADAERAQVAQVVAAVVAEHGIAGHGQAVVGTRDAVDRATGGDGGSGQRGVRPQGQVVQVLLRATRGGHAAAIETDGTDCIGQHAGGLHGLAEQGLATAVNRQTAQRRHIPQRFAEGHIARARRNTQVIGQGIRIAVHGRVDCRSKGNITHACVCGHDHVARQGHGRLEADVGVAGGDVTRQGVAASTALGESPGGGDVSRCGRGKRTGIGNGGGPAHIGRCIHRQIFTRKGKATRQVHRATQGSGAATGLLSKAGSIHSRQGHILRRDHVHRAQRGGVADSARHGHIAGTDVEGQVVGLGSLGIYGRAETHIAVGRRQRGVVAHDHRTRVGLRARGGHLIGVDRCLAADRQHRHIANPVCCAVSQHRSTGNGQALGVAVHGPGGRDHAARQRGISAQRQSAVVGLAVSGFNAAAIEREVGSRHRQVAEFLTTAHRSRKADGRQRVGGPDVHCQVIAAGDTRIDGGLEADVLLVCRQGGVGADGHRAREALVPRAGDRRRVDDSGAGNRQVAQVAQVVATVVAEHGIAGHG